MQPKRTSPTSPTQSELSQALSRLRTDLAQASALVRILERSPHIDQHTQYKLVDTPQLARLQALIASLPTQLQQLITCAWSSPRTPSRAAQLARSIFQHKLPKP